MEGGRSVAAGEKEVFSLLLWEVSELKGGAWLEPVKELFCFLDILFLTTMNTGEGLF